jgi:hypothetical protein
MYIYKNPLYPVSLDISSWDQHSFQSSQTKVIMRLRGELLMAQSEKLSAFERMLTCIWITFHISQANLSDISTFSRQFQTIVTWRVERSCWKGARRIWILESRAWPVRSAVCSAASWPNWGSTSLLEMLMYRSFRALARVTAVFIIFVLILSQRLR